MKHSRLQIITVLATAILTSNIARGLDLQPEFIATELEGGFKNKEVALPDGNRRVLYCYPNDWRPESAVGKLRFSPPDVPLADLSVEVENIDKAIKLDDTEASRLREQIAKWMPKDSTEINIEGESREGLVINKYPTLELTATFASTNQHFRMSVLFLYADSTAVRFITVAREGDFAKVHETVRKSLYSWRWVPRQDVKVKSES